jgi:hypothetical protein
MRPFLNQVFNTNSAVPTQAAAADDTHHHPDIIAIRRYGFQNRAAQQKTVDRR